MWVPSGSSEPLCSKQGRKAGELISCPLVLDVASLAWDFVFYILHLVTLRTSYRSCLLLWETANVSAASWFLVWAGGLRSVREIRELGGRSVGSEGPDFPT